MLECIEIRLLFSDYMTAVRDMPHSNWGRRLQPEIQCHVSNVGRHTGMPTNGVDRWHGGKRIERNGKECSSSISRRQKCRHNAMNTKRQYRTRTLIRRAQSWLGTPHH